MRLEQLEQATGGEGDDAEHQVAEDLEVAADPQMTTAVVVLDGAVDAFGGGALVVDQVIRIGHVDGTAGGAFGGDFDLQRGLTAGVAIDDRAPSRRLAIGDDRGGIVGGVPDVVEPDDALLALAGERDGDLAVVNRGRGKNGGDRHHAGGDVEMELVAVPAGGEAATVALATGIAADRQFGEHLVEGLAALAFDPGQRLGRRGLALARPTTPARRLGWRRRIIGGRRRVRGLWLGLGFFTPVDLGCVAGDVAEDVAVQSIADEVLMNPLGQVLRGEFAEGAGERPFAGDIAAPLPPANAAERAVDVQALDQRRGGGMLSTALATKARAICGRSSAGRPRPRPGGAT